MKIIVCDQCKDRNKEAGSIVLPTGRFTPDPAGGPSNQDYEYFDLCLQCAIKMIHDMRHIELADTNIKTPIRIHTSLNPFIAHRVI